MATQMMQARYREMKLQSLPIRAMSIWETLPDVRSTITQLVQGGHFRMAAQLADELWADDRFMGVLDTRTDALLSAPVAISPADDSRKARKAVEMLGVSDDDASGTFDEIFPDWMTGDVSVGGNVLNMGLAKIEWEDVDGVHMPRVTPMHAQFVRWDWNTRSYWFLTENMGEVELPRLDENPRGDGNWLLWTPFGYGNLRKAMIRWMGPLLIMRRWNEADWANYNEVYGKPMKIGYVPSGAKEEEQDAFMAELDAAGANSTAKVPRPATSAEGGGSDVGYGVGLVEAKSRGWDTFEGFKAAKDKDIAVGYLGVNLLTDAQGGSLALSQEQTPLFLNRVTKDAKLAKAIRMQVLTHWAERNLGDWRLAPRVRYEVQPAESEAEEGAGYKALGDGAAALKAGGIPVDARALGEAHGIPLVSPEEEAAQKEEAAQQMRDAVAKANGGQGGGGEGGADPGTKPDAPPAKKGSAEMQARYVAVPPVRRYTFQGLPVAVENPTGSTRVWRDEGADGEVIGQTHMLHDYGYIEGYIGGDKEELDCYVGPDADAKDVHVVHQLRAPGYKAHDEDKTMLGFRDAGAAKAAYLAHRNDGESAFGGMSTIPLDRFKAKLQRRTGTGKITAHAHVAQRATVMLERAEAIVLAAATPKAKRRAKLYGDRVADEAIKLAEGLLGEDRRAVLAAIKECKSLEDIRPTLRAVFAEMDPAALSDLVYRARTMARVGGKAAAVKRL